MPVLLLPVDGSDPAARAVAWVARIFAGRADVHVHLAHVQSGDDGWELQSHMSASMRARLHADRAAQVLEPPATALRAAGLAVETHALSGTVAEALAAAVRDLGCDGVVMGTRGLGAVQSLVLGSTATQVIHLVDVPVTLLK